MRFRAAGMKLGLAAAALIAALSMGGPAAQAAGATVVVDDASLATSCGAYTGKPASTDLATALAGLTSGTVVVCPGNYGGLDNVLVDTAKNLTIKQAVPGPENRPHFTSDDGTTFALHIQNSINVIIDGLVIDTTPYTSASTAVYYDNSSGSVRNSVLLGSATTSSLFVRVTTTTLTKMVVSSSLFQGYQYGIVAMGPVTLTVLGSTLDATNGGLLGPVNTVGITFSGRQSADGRLGGMVSKNTLLNNQTGVLLDEVGKVSVTANLMSANGVGVEVQTRGDYRGADNNKITANTIISIPAISLGVWVYDTDQTAPETTIHGLVISKNRFAAAQYIYNGTSAGGIFFQQLATDPGLITATVSGNTFTGFAITPDPLYSSTSGPGPVITLSGNTHTP